MGNKDSSPALTEKVATRFTKPDLVIIDSVASERGQSQSQFIRFATLHYLAELGQLDQSRAMMLGVKAQETA